MAHPSSRISQGCLALALAWSPLLAAPPAQEPPILKPRPMADAGLDFTGGAPLKEVLQRLGKAGGVAISLHAAVAAQETTVAADLRRLPFQQALDLVLLQNNLFAKVLAHDAVMIFKRTPQNLQEFETRVQRTYTLAFADPDQVRQTLNALHPQLRIFPDKRMGALTVLGNTADLAAVEDLLANVDKAKAEVQIDLEILEGDRQATQAAGLPALAAAAPTPQGQTPGLERALETLRKAGGTRMLAKPFVRVVAGDTAEVRVPALETGRYRVMVKPRIHPDGTLTLALDCAATPAAAPDQAHPETMLRTSVRVKDGETAAFGGLLAGGEAQAKDLVLVLKARVIRPAAR
ncbi:secretin N-terminal domain-containing protein [Mesoterricola sediminis]|uniref:NolW-like domain-containing protein n=1 Tax=Mesoterricola sediminis TaxID=2927980 RepID=A0AA48KDA5_9BACT|nr:secretin N-terminal domain-containing protein [Mesoterricola sediminis]BDU76880.1 hypothetical protein METESE_18380 [Mesoterricola sediminis]